MDLDELTNDDGLMVRTFAIRAKDTAKREFTGIGVPFGETYDMGYGLFERFEPGAIDPADGAKIFWQHREVIGKVITGKDTKAGHEITSKISDTAQGRDAWTLLEDGVVDRLSIGFIPVEYRTETDEAGNTTIIHTKVKTREFSLVNHPAYTEAKVSAIRSALTHTKEAAPMVPEADTLTRADLTPLADGLAEMERSIAKLGNPAPAGPAIPQFRSIGEYVRAIASGDADALQLHADLTNRAAPANVLADAIVKDSWIGDFTRLVEDRRRIMNQFGRGTLPATGMNVEYGQLAEDTTAVGKQNAEGDDLTGPGKVALEVETAPVLTGGGWSSLSFQAIQRATIPTLNTLWRAMAIKYGAWTNQQVQDAYYALITAKLASANPDDALDLTATPATDDYLDLVIDAALIFEERGYTISGLNASVDEFKQLARLEDGDGRRLMNVFGAGMNQVGELNLQRVDGSLANVPVSLIGKRSTTGKLAFYDSIAFETLESPGAPTQLQDENIINLTKQLSLYGYIAVTNPFPGAILPVKRGV
jgi:HK97 family phage prohead protease